MVPADCSQDDRADQDDPDGRDVAHVPLVERLDDPILVMAGARTTVDSDRSKHGTKLMCGFTAYSRVPALPIRAQPTLGIGRT
jgi:hypothetical protein